MSTPRAAGVIATWNQADYIAEAVRSLAEEVDEVVVVDDASTDGTFDVLSSFASDTIRVIRNEHQMGVSRSFNRAIESTTSEIVLIQGGDDRTLPGRAERQVAALMDASVALCASAPAVIDAVGRRLPDDAAAEFLIGPGDQDPLPYLFFVANYLCAPSAAVRREDYLRLGGFPPGIALLQDHSLWLRLAAEGSVHLDAEPLVEYRKHGTNTSREYVGIDAPSQRLLSAEREHVLGDFVRTASRNTLDRLARSVGVSANRRTHLAEDELGALILVSHPDKLIVRRGLAELFRIAGTPGGDERFHEMGLQNSDLSHLAAIADHGGLAEITRALGIARQLDPGKA